MDQNTIAEGEKQCFLMGSIDAHTHFWYAERCIFRRFRPNSSRPTQHGSSGTSSSKGNCIQIRLKRFLVLVGLGVLRGLTLLKESGRVFFTYGLGKPLFWIGRGVFRIGLLPMYTRYITIRQRVKTHPRLAGIRSLGHFIERYAVYAVLVTVGVLAVGNNIFARTIRPDEIGIGAIWTSYTNSETSELIVETATTPSTVVRNTADVAIGARTQNTPTNQAADTTSIPEQTTTPLAIGGPLPTTDAGATNSTAPGTQVARQSTIEYTVQNGDTLSTIAHQFDLTSKTLVWANNLSDKDFIKPGQTLKIPPVEGYLYTVKKNDTLAKIVKTYGGTQDQVIATNHLASASDIQPGDEIVIPGGEPPAPVAPTVQTPPKLAQVFSGNNGGSGTPPPSAPATGAKFVWPTTSHRINQYFRGRYHTGIDIDGDVGNAIYAAAAGKVVYAAFDKSGYGLHVVIDHGNGYETLYGHASKLFVSAGDYVKQGQTIAAVGSTGHSTGPHLHFEIRFGGGFLNPLSFY